MKGVWAFQVKQQIQNEMGRIQSVAFGVLMRFPIWNTMKITEFGALT